MNSKNKISKSVFGFNSSNKDKRFIVFNYILLFIAGAICLYPLLYVVSSSFSSTEAVVSGKVLLLPVGFTTRAYEAVFQYGDIWIGYKNTIFYAVVGTAINVMLTVMVAYPLSRIDLYGRKVITFLLTFTMMFSAGLIPTYLLMQDFNLLNTRAVIIILGLLNVRNIILARSFYEQSLGKDIIEAARIDGANEWNILIKIVIPLSKAIIAVVGLYSLVQYWNEFFNSLIYISDRTKYPLQLFLRQILIMNTIDPSMSMLDEETMSKINGLQELMKYAIIVVSTLPVMVMYPFVQKFFVKGVMTGAVKG